MGDLMLTLIIEASCHKTSKSVRKPPNARHKNYETITRSCGKCCRVWTRLRIERFFSRPR